MLCSSLRGRPFLPFATERLILRPFRPEDAEALANLANDKRVAERLASLPYPYTLEDARKFIERTQGDFISGNLIQLAIVHREKGYLMGSIGWGQTLGYWLGHDFWGHGYMKEATHSFVSVLFFVTDLDTIEGSALQSNTASNRIFKGLGFKKTGTREVTSLAFKGTQPGFTYELSRTDFYKKAIDPSFPKVWAAGALLLDKDNRLLVAQRLPSKLLGGVWEMPGGKIEAGESPEEALARELKEELDITVEAADLKPLMFISYLYETFHVIILGYTCRKWEGTPYGAEGQTIKWVTYRDLTTLPLLPASLKAVSEVMHGI